MKCSKGPSASGKIRTWSGLGHKYRFAPVCFTSGLGSGSRRSIRVSATTREREMELEQVNEKGILQKGIAEFYDESSGIWEDIWGDHMHIGFMKIIR